MGRSPNRLVLEDGGIRRQAMDRRGMFAEDTGRRVCQSRIGQACGKGNGFTEHRAVRYNLLLRIGILEPPALEVDRVANEDALYRVRLDRGH